MLVVVCDARVGGVVPFRMGMGMIVFGGAVPMPVRMDNNLAGAAAFNAVLAADFACSFAFRTLFVHEYSSLFIDLCGRFRQFPMRLNYNNHASRTPVRKRQLPESVGGKAGERASGPGIVG